MAMNSFSSTTGSFRPTQAELDLASADKTGTMTATFDYLSSLPDRARVATHIKNKLMLLDKGTLEAWIVAAETKRPILEDALVEKVLLDAIGLCCARLTPRFADAPPQSPWTYLRSLLEAESFMPYGEASVIDAQASLAHLATLKSTTFFEEAQKFIHNRWNTAPPTMQRRRSPGEYELAKDDNTLTMNLFFAQSTPFMPPYVKNAMMVNMSTVALLKWLAKGPMQCPHVSNALYERALMHEMQYGGVLPRPRTQMEILMQACEEFKACDEHDPAPLLQVMLEVESYSPYSMVDVTFMQNKACRYVDKVLAPHWELPKVRLAVLYMFRRWQYWPGRWCATSSPLGAFMKLCWAKKDPIWREFFVSTHDEHDDHVRYEIFEHCEFNGLQFEQCASEIGKGDGAARTLAFLCQRATPGMHRGILFYSVEAALCNASSLCPLLKGVLQTVLATHGAVPAMPDHLQESLSKAVSDDPEANLRLWHLYDVPMQRGCSYAYLKAALEFIADQPTLAELAEYAQGDGGTAGCSFDVANMPRTSVEISWDGLKAYEGIRLIMGIVERMASVVSHSFYVCFMDLTYEAAVKAVYKLTRAQRHLRKEYRRANADNDVLRAANLQADLTQLLHAVGSAEQVVLQMAKWRSKEVALAICECPYKRKFLDYMENLPCASKMWLLDVFANRYYEKGEAIKLEKLLKTLLCYDFDAALRHGVFTYALRLETPFYSLEPLLRAEQRDDDATEDDDATDVDEVNLLAASVRRGLTDVSGEVRNQVFAKQAAMLHPEYEIATAHEFVYFCKTFDPMPMPKVAQGVFDAVLTHGDWIPHVLALRPNFRRRYYGRHLLHVTTGMATGTATPHEKALCTRKKAPEATSKALLDDNVRRMIASFM